MKIVIDVPDNMQEMCRWHKDCVCNLTSLEIDILAESVKNGTALPKGYGRLIDVENAKTKLCRVAEKVPEPSKSCYIMSALYLDNTNEFPTVIEADREEENET